MKRSSPCYTNQNNDRINNHGMYQELDWVLTSFKKEHNISNIRLIELLHKNIEYTIENKFRQIVK